MPLISLWVPEMRNGQPGGQCWEGSLDKLDIDRSCGIDHSDDEARGRNGFGQIQVEKGELANNSWIKTDPTG